MAIDLVLESLRRVPLFAALTSEQIAEIGRGAQRRAFRKGEVIAAAGEPGDGAYLILLGEAVCRTGPDARRAAEPVEQGSLVGELAMLVECDYGTTVVAQGWVDCLKLERATLHEQMHADPGIAQRIADAIRDRLSLVAAELEIVDRLLTGCIEPCAPLALLTPRSAKKAPAGQAASLAP
jgi:CRP/FNR family transcriptional regulator, cyclic AMP receptor protein